MSEAEEQQVQSPSLTIAEAFATKTIESEFNSALSDDPSADLANIKTREDIVWLIALQNKVASLLSTAQLTKREGAAVLAKIKSITLSQALGVPREQFDEHIVMDYQINNLKAMLLVSRSDASKGLFLDKAIVPEKHTKITVGREEKMSLQDAVAIQSQKQADNRQKPMLTRSFQ